MKKLLVLLITLSAVFTTNLWSQTSWTVSGRVVNEPSYRYFEWEGVLNGTDTLTTGAFSFSRIEKPAIVVIAAGGNNPVNIKPETQISVFPEQWEIYWNFGQILSRFKRHIFSEYPVNFPGQLNRIVLIGNSGNGTNIPVKIKVIQIN